MSTYNLQQPDPSDVQTYDQLSRAATGQPALARPVDSDELLGREISRLNGLANSYDHQVKQIKADKRYSDQHKQKLIAGLKQQTLVELQDQVDMLYGRGNPDGTYDDGGLVPRLLDKTQQAIDQARSEAEAELDLTRLAAVQSEVSGSLTRFSNLQQLQAWYDQASPLEQRALLSCRDRLQQQFADTVGIGSFLKRLDSQQDSWQDTPAAEAARQVQFDLDRNLVKLESSIHWCFDRLNSQLMDGPFSSPLTRRMQQFSPRHRQQQVAATPLG